MAEGSPETNGSYSGLPGFAIARIRPIFVPYVHRAVEFDPRATDPKHDVRRVVHRHEVTREAGLAEDIHTQLRNRIAAFA